MIGWLLNIAYALLLFLATPWIAWRSIRYGRYRRGWQEKLFGRLPVRTQSEHPVVWLHAVSVGEVLLLPVLVQRLLARRPDLQFLITTSTDSGYDLARERFPEHGVSWLPLDFTWTVKAAIRRVRPDLLVLVELELWPNLIRAATAADVPLTVVNGRLSERSFRGYRRVRALIAPLLERFAFIAAQTDAYAGRFVRLGAPGSRISVTGSIKFDGVSVDRTEENRTDLAAEVGVAPGNPAFVAGSTQAGEEEAALEAWLSARVEHPELQLILVPRHRERFNDVAAMLEKRGVPFRRRSQPEDDRSGADERASVLLVDTIGELSAVWGLADIAYVGGSLFPGRGGQNMLEPAACGAAVLFGPYTENFRAVVDSLLAQDAAWVVTSPDELTRALKELFRDRIQRHGMGHRAREFVLSQQGAADRTVDGLCRLLANGHTTRRAA